jgi:hypothetical protein
MRDNATHRTKLHEICLAGSISSLCTSSATLRGHIGITISQKRSECGFGLQSRHAIKSALAEHAGFQWDGRAHNIPSRRNGTRRQRKRRQRSMRHLSIGGGKPARINTRSCGGKHEAFTETNVATNVQRSKQFRQLTHIDAKRRRRGGVSRSGQPGLCAKAAPGGTCTKSVTCAMQTKQCA